MKGPGTAGDNEELTVRFSEVHWYEVKVPRAELQEAAGGDIFKGVIMVLVSQGQDYPEAVTELLTAASIDQPGALKETDGLEVHSISPQIRPARAVK